MFPHFVLKIFSVLCQSCEPCVRVGALEDHDDLMGTYRQGNNRYLEILENIIVLAGGREHRLS